LAGVPKPLFLVRLADNGVAGFRHSEDDLRRDLARRFAVRLRLRLTGTLGLLLKAKKTGQIESVRPDLDRLEDLRFDSRRRRHVHVAMARKACATRDGSLRLSFEPNYSVEARDVSSASFESSGRGGRSRGLQLLVRRGWNRAKLAPWLNSEDPVGISGWLMLDPDQKNHLGRFWSTLWEIYPITRIEVWQDGQWKDLDGLQ
jgi:hypothetical protein